MIRAAAWKDTRLARHAGGRSGKAMNDGHLPRNPIDGIKPIPPVSDPAVSRL